MAKACILMAMALLTKVLGKMINKMAGAKKFGQMALSMREISFRGGRKAKELLNLQMVVFFMVIS